LESSPNFNKFAEATLACSDPLDDWVGFPTTYPATYPTTVSDNSSNNTNSNNNMAHEEVGHFDNYIYIHILSYIILLYAYT
jgi:hypothetical protein